MTKEKVVLAYSGGLDTSIAIKWIQDKYNLDVIALAVDLGQGKDLAGTKEKALKIGAVESIVVNAIDEFANDFIVKALKANAVYENKYPLATALARPLIGKILVETAEEMKASFVAHGSTGKGNDQVRFDLAVMALNPSLKIIAPVREWSMSREEEIKYAEKNNIPIPVTSESPYSIDLNIWGRSIECGILEDPWQEPLSNVYELTRDVNETPDDSEYLEITFEKGIPVKMNNVNMTVADLVIKLNQVGGMHGIGRIDQVENRLVGIKSREIYECPAAVILLTTHKELESLTLTKDVLHFKYGIEQKYSELIYNGLWYSALKEALDAFIENTQEYVSGTVRLKLHKGNCVVVGRKSDYSLYDYNLATYDEKDEFSHKSAEGFIEIWGLPVKVWAGKQRDVKRKM
ncbi:MAG: argininosuccinate synthase [Actinobacteria bacterium]|nr:argininosuccinate synthase [Actinomycetota bacterium]